MSIYQKSVPLPPGTYRLNVVVKDVFGGNMNNYEMALTVPRMEDDQFVHSSVILADVIEKVPTRSIGAGQFVIGTTKVRPRVTESFSRGEKMGIYMKLYNFEADEKTRKPNGEVIYEVTKVGSDVKVFEFAEELKDGSPTEVTIEKLLPLKTLEPGTYELKMKVTDKIRNQTLTPTAKFTVT
jgi:5-hydroxyisourate hydrolase-like protein (transthyretin family)